MLRCVKCKTPISLKWLLFSKESEANAYSCNKCENKYKLERAPAEVVGLIAVIALGVYYLIEPYLNNILFRFVLLGVVVLLLARLSRIFMVRESE